MEGYLECHISGQLLSHRYYFIHHEDTIIYCRKKGEEKLGQIHLGICELVRTSKIEILINTGCNEIKIKGSPHELDLWETHLNQNEKLQTDEALTDELAKVKSLYSQFDDFLKQLTSKLEGNPSLAASAEELEKNGTQLRTQINDWLQQMENVGRNEKNDSEFQSCMDNTTPINLPSLASIQDIKALLPTQPSKYFYLSNSVPFRDLMYTINQQRSQLPQVRSNALIYNKWAELKHQLYGSSIVVPIYLCEPLSLLQRYCEGMFYATLLEQADMMNDSGLRLALVVGFVIGQFSHLWNRQLAPFLGQSQETFDFEHTFKFIAEQINPNLTCFDCSSDKFQIQVQVGWEWSFVNAVLLLEPQIKCEYQVIMIQKEQISRRVRIGSRCNFQISSSKYITSSPRSLMYKQMGKSFSPIMPQVWQKQFYQKDESAEVQYDNHLGSLNLISGSIHKDAQMRYTISGQWHKSISAFHNVTKEEMIIFRKQPDADKINMTDFGLQLNHLHQWNLQMLPITDSRFRGDTRALESSQNNLKLKLDNFDLAYTENQKIRKRQFINSEPQWFYKNEDEKYVYNDKYFKLKNSNKFIDQLSIF